MPFGHLIALISNAHLCSPNRERPEKDALGRVTLGLVDTTQKDQIFIRIDPAP